MSNVKLIYKDREYSLPVVEGTEGERAIDIASLRKETGLITLDPGYGNTGACTSAITFIDGERGILRYRGYPIEEIAEHARFTEVCYLLIYGERPTLEELREFRRQMTLHTLIHEDMKKFYEGYPPSAHPMAIMAAMVASLSTFYPDDDDDARSQHHSRARQEQDARGVRPQEVASASRSSIRATTCRGPRTSCA